MTVQFGTDNEIAIMKLNSAPEARGVEGNRFPSTTRIDDFPVAGSKNSPNPYGATVAGAILYHTDNVLISKNCLEVALGG